MDKFIVDRQTLEELNLLGKYRRGSVFNLFNHTVTKGGEILLEKMLSDPLSCAQAIKDRSALFAFFERDRLDFPFTGHGEQVQQWADWLDNDQPSGKLASYIGIAKKKVLKAAIGDEGYQRSKEGIVLTARILKELRLYVDRLLSIPDAPASISQRLVQLKNILWSAALLTFFDFDVESDISVLTLGRLEYVLKNDMEAEVRFLLTFLYEADVYAAVSSVARKNGYTHALVLEDTVAFRVQSLKHPALEKAVGNDLTLDTDRNFLFLTGANMAGKSTFMKSIGIALYLAHAGFPVAASSMEFSIQEGLFTSINVPDNIQLGYSHFYAEVLRVKQAAQLVSNGKKLLVIFDELFKGTNVQDAYEGTLEVSKAFAAYRNCLFVISTHIIEVGETLMQLPSVKAGFMPTQMKDTGPVYTYTLQTGITEDRQGMLIIKNEGILELLS